MFNMKKIFTLLSVMLFTMTVNAQNPNKGDVQELHNNYVIYTCAPGDAKVVESPVAYQVDKEKSAFEELGINYQCNNTGNTNMVVVTSDYLDAETGASFPAGYYYPAKIGGSRSYFASAADVSGLKNVKKVIFYFAAGSSGGVQFSSYFVREHENDVPAVSVPSDQSGNTYSPSVKARWSMDLNNKIKFAVPENLTETADGVKIFSSGNNYYNTLMVDGKPSTDWTTFQCEKPCKLVLDLTKHGDLYDGSYDFTKDLSGVVEVPYANANIAKQDANGKEVPGTNIPWSADNILVQGFKKAAYLLGIAFVCGDDNAKTYYANVSESTDEDEAKWHESSSAAVTPFAATDEPEYNLFFTWKTTPEFVSFVKANYATGISDITVNSAKKDAAYNLAGQAVNASYKGIVIKGGKKFRQN